MITLKGTLTTIVVRWWNRIILHAVDPIILQFHAIWTTTQLAVRDWETEVAAPPIGRLGALAGECCEKRMWVLRRSF